MRRFLALIMLAGCGGGGDDDPDSQLSCDTVPTCYSDALDALRACVPLPDFALGPVNPQSGVVDGLTCTSADVGISFSAFSENPNGTVPVPSGVTITSAGGFCAELGSGTGTHTDMDGNMLAFDLVTLRVGAGDDIMVLRYENGDLGVNCAPPDPDNELTAQPGDLEDCPGAVMFHEVIRNDDITEIGVELLDALDVRTELFTCTPP